MAFRSPLPWWRGTWAAFLASLVLTSGGCRVLVTVFVARAPNHECPPDPNRDPSAKDLSTLGVARSFLVDVGPPPALLRVWVVEPSKTIATHRGTILILHGWWCSSRCMLSYAKALAEAGFRCALVDLRGQGRSSGDWLTYGVLESRDLTQVLNALENSGVAEHPVGVFGISYGAAVSLQFAARDDRVEAVVALAPFSSLRECVPHYVRLCLPIWGWLAPERWIQAAVSNAGKLGGFDPDAASSIAAARILRAPALLIHGGSDWLIPAEHSRRIHAASPERTELVVLDGIGHNRLLFDPGGQVSRLAVEWLSDRLGAAKKR